MTHNEKRSSAAREAQLALFTGTIFGATHTLSGHPLDTIKSKMQVQVGYANDSALVAARKMYAAEGFKAFFRGVVPPLWGSMVYRAINLSAYEMAFTWFETSFPTDSVAKIEVLGFLRPMIVPSAIFAGLCRSLFENPIEYAKVMGQTGKKWVLQDVYRGMHWQVLRTTGLLIPIFGSIDWFRRHTQVMNSTYGNFAVTAGSAAGSYLLCWPLETLKNLSQSSTPRPGASIREKIAYLGGPLGVYRGVGPGVLCGGLRNGFAFVSMVYAQGWATKLGLRD